MSHETNVHAPIITFYSVRQKTEPHSICEIIARNLAKHQQLLVQRIRLTQSASTNTCYFVSHINSRAETVTPQLTGWLRRQLEIVVNQNKLTVFDSDPSTGEAAAWKCFETSTFEPKNTSKSTYVSALLYCIAAQWLHPASSAYVIVLQRISFNFTPQVYLHSANSLP